MKITALKSFILIATLLFTYSCGKTTEQEIADGIDSALILLSTKQCQPAIDLLENIGRQNKNASYIKALASAYACRAGYSTTTLFLTDLSKTASPSPLGGMSTYTTSLSTVSSPLQNDSKFQDLQTAITLLMYAGGIASTTEPTATERAKYFTAAHVGDINAELAYMLLVQIGKVMKVYGNTSATGVKGGGSAGNSCFSDYSTTPAAVQAYIQSGGQTGACTSVSSSHTQLAAGATNRRARLCQGVVLLNSLLDVLPIVLATAGGGDLDDISGVTDQIDDFKDDLIALDPSFGTTATVMSQTNCETDSAITVDTLASYYAVLYESLVQ